MKTFRQMDLFQEVGKNHSDNDFHLVQSVHRNYITYYIQNKPDWTGKKNSISGRLPISHTYYLIQKLDAVINESYFSYRIAYAGRCHGTYLRNAIKFTKANAL